MMRNMLKSKIHRARVTGVRLDYEGSITIDRELMREADILPYEQVHVLNLNNGARFSTYAIEGRAGGGQIELNGAAARLAVKGDIVIILAYAPVPEDEVMDFQPRLVYVNKENQITGVKRAIGALTVGE